MLLHASGQSHAKRPYSPHLKHFILDISLCPFPLESPLVLCHFLCSLLPFWPLFWLLFLLGQSAALCPNSPQYPQRPLNAFLGFFLLDWLVKRA